jgi:hypothetical protein
MAEIVAAFGVPHTPAFPALVAKEGPDCETAKLYAEIAKRLRAAAPDVLVIYTDDHFNTFFLDNFPTFAIGIADETSGPNDQTPMPSYRVAVQASLATHLRAAAIGDGFDISLVQDFDVDHATMVPLHFLTPEMNVAIVPIFVNGLAPPLPSSELVAEATTARLARAGNIAGELLNWIAMLGVVGEHKPTFIAPQINQGHAYAAWRLD